MADGVPHLFVMKSTQSPFLYPGPRPAYRIVDILKVTIIMLSAVFTLLVALSYPVTAGRTVIAMLIVGLLTFRALRRRDNHGLRRVITSVSNAITQNVNTVQRTLRQV